MHHVLIEFITGGGMTGEPLPEHLQLEGDLMLQELVNGLVKAGQDSISVTRDKRCALDLDNINQLFIENSLISELPLLQDDETLYWLIAPETDLHLYKLAKQLIDNGCHVISSQPEAIRLTGSKMKTCEALTAAAIETVETCYLGDTLPQSDSGWVIKPDDGVGGEQCIHIKEQADIERLRSGQDSGNPVIQPFIEGENLSMSILVQGDHFQLLACNRQDIGRDNTAIYMKGFEVNACLHYQDACRALAGRIVKAIPGLAGYIGVDLIQHNGTLYVVDINPRFTTTFTGISESLGVNIVEVIMNAWLNKNIATIDLAEARPVRINV